MLDGEVDLAVHSAKDLPGELPEGLAIVGAPARAAANDRLLGAFESLDELPPGTRVGTASLRRRSQLLALRPDLAVEEVRGNVDTRLGKLAAGEYDALLLAAAGLDRLGRGEVDHIDLDAELFVPAPGQGTLALEGRTGDRMAAELAGAIADPQSHTELLAERAVCRVLGASCHTPVGVHAHHLGGRLAVTAYIGLGDGSAWLRDSLAGNPDTPEELGRDFANRLLSAGARELLAEAETQVP